MMRTGLTIRHLDRTGENMKRKSINDLDVS